MTEQVNIAPQEDVLPQQDYIDNDTDLAVEEPAGNLAEETSEGSGVELGEQELVTPTFEDAMKRRKVFTPEGVLKIVNDELTHDSGTRAFNVKDWLDNSEPDESDREFIDPESIANFHHELTELVQANLKVAVASKDPRIREYVAGQKDVYLALLSERTRDFAEKVQLFADGQRVRGLGDDASFGGFMVSTPSGNIDISRRDNSGKAGEVRPNITVQSEIAGAFVNWETDSRVRAKLSGEAEPPARRIYLNPRNGELCNAFSSIMTALNSAGLEVHGKMLDRSTEATSRLRETESGQGQRADAIVLYVSDEDADEVLGAVFALSKDMPEAFEGRSIPRVSQKVVDGISVGDEPLDSKGESLTTSRAGLLSLAVQETREELGLDTSVDTAGPERSGEVYDTFMRKLKEKSAEMGVNPDNIAFNLAA